MWNLELSLEGSSHLELTLKYNFQNIQLSRVMTFWYKSLEWFVSFDGTARLLVHIELLSILKNWFNTLKLIDIQTARSGISEYLKLHGMSNCLVRSSEWLIIRIVLTQSGSALGCQWSAEDILSLLNIISVLQSTARELTIKRGVAHHEMEWVSLAGSDSVCWQVVVRSYRLAGSGRWLAGHLVANV